MSITQELNKTLYFKNPIFHDGLNYTVRLGRKWDHLENGDKLILTQTGALAAPEYQATVKDVIVCTYRHIPAFVLEFEHDPTCRTFAGLNKAMKRAYRNFYPLDAPQYIVTCIGFVIEDERNPRLKRKK